MLKFLKKNYKYIVLFFVILVVQVLLQHRFMDALHQYGISHAIKNGQRLYLDINTISTPFYFFLCSLFLRLWDNYLLFLIINSIIAVGIYYFAEKVLKKHWLFYVLVTLLPLCDVLCPSYNLLAKLLIMILIYLEQNQKSDYWIGFLLGLLLLTKHTIGIPVIICSFLACLNLKRCGKRMIGLMIPTIVFLLYLVGTKSLYCFIDLTILGLFDFENKNTLTINYIIIATILMSLYYGIYLVRHRKNQKENIIVLYAVGSLSFLIPIFDLNHFSCAFPFFILVLMEKQEFRINYTIMNSFLMGLILLFGYLYITHVNINSFKTYPHFLIYIEESNKNEKVLKKYKEEYPKSIMITPQAMWYDIILDKKITYYDIPLTGNYGKGGSQSMIDNLSSNTYYFIPKGCGSLVTQYDNKICEYIANHASFVEEDRNFQIYYLE